MHVGPYHTSPASTNTQLLSCTNTQLHQHSADQVHKSDVTDSPGAEIYRERRSVPPCCSTPSVEQRVVCESSATSVCPCLQCVDRGSEATFLCSHDQWRHQVFITGPGHRTGFGVS